MGAAFLPLTTDAARQVGAGDVACRAAEAEAAADATWASLLGGCNSARRWGLDTSLRQLSDAVRFHVGTKWWFSEGTPYRRRLAQAQGCIEDAVTESDGPEFARSFMGYDNAMAGAILCAGERGTRLRTGP